MASGLYSTIHSLQTRLHHRWCAKWYEAFSHPDGGFYERLGKGFQPVLTGQRRLVTQCRQLSVYSHAAATSKNRYPHLKAQFEFILDRYHNAQTGLWHFALDDKGEISDRTCDLYALSFVIFACSHYQRANRDDRARDTAMQVLNLINRKFRMQRGLAEALGPDGIPLQKMRRQNPHMHLLEACLFAYETWRDPAFLSMADEMVALFYSCFFDAESCALVEFFDDDLSPHPDKGRELEPGHYFEWVWLLKKHAALKGDEKMHDQTAFRLFDWANRFGWDSLHGGIYDVVAPDGAVIMDSKRIWPFCEALKANALMLTLTPELAPDRQAVKDRVAAMVSLFEKKYMQERGFWTEWLTRDLSPVTDYMPGTTPYHVYFGIVETMEVLNRRGGNKSIAAMFGTGLYKVRRTASGIFKLLKP